MEQQAYYDPQYYLPPEHNPYYKKAQRKNLSRIGFAFITYYLVVVVVQLAMVLGCQWLFPAFVKHPAYQWIQQLVPSYLLGFPIFAGLLMGMPKKAPEKKKITPVGWISFLAVSFFFMLAGSYIAGWLMTALETIRGTQITNAIDQQITKSSPLMNLVLIVIIGPIVEELMCRKLILDRLLPYSEWLAVITGGLFFGLLHGNFYQFFYAAFLGILFSYVYVKTGSILHTIIMHMIINFTGSIITDFINKMTSDLASAPTSINPWDIVASVYSTAMIALAICGAILFFQKLKKHGLKGEGSRGLSLSTQFNLTWLNPGTITYCVLCILLFASSLFI